MAMSSFVRLASILTIQISHFDSCKQWSYPIVTHTGKYRTIRYILDANKMAIPMCSI